MKKSRILGYALTLAATLFVGSAMGQVVRGDDGRLPAATRFVKTGAVDGIATETKMLVTKSKPTGVYVLPDVNYHPGYTQAGSWTLTAGHEWNWTEATTKVTLTKNGDANYVEMKSTVVGVYPINVKEAFAAGFGACGDATGKDITLVVFDTPTLAFDASTERPITSDCGDQTAYEIKMNISATDFINVKFHIEEYPITITAGAPTKGALRSSTVYNTAKLKVGAAATTVAPFTYAIAGAAFNFDTDTQNRSLVLSAKRNFIVNASDFITLYRVVIDATDGGINDFVSRKSDHDPKTAADPVGGYSFYDAPTAVVAPADPTKFIDIFVKKAPSTGPVYHINNNIAK